MERSNALFWMLSRQGEVNIDRGDGWRKIIPTRESIRAMLVTDFVLVNNEEVIPSKCTE